MPNRFVRHANDHGRENMAEERMNDAKAERVLHRRLDRVQRLLPGFLADWLNHLRHPSASWFRVPLGILFIFGGFFSFLPVLGIWMLPLGLILLALDFALLRRPTAALIVGSERRWGRVRRWWRGESPPAATERRDAELR